MVSDFPMGRIYREHKGKIIHRVYTINPAQNNVSATLFPIMLPIYCVCYLISDSAANLLSLSLLPFSWLNTCRNTYYTI